MSCLNLVWTFFRIGALTFGGGYAMIPLIISELTGQGYLTHAEVTDIIAVSQVTPGTFAINAATFSGVKIFGIFGGVAATLGVMLPSLILASLMAHFYTKFQQSHLIKSAMRTIRPVVLGLIGSAVIILIPNIILNNPELITNISTFFASIDLIAVLIATAAVISVLILKISPIYVVLASGFLGIVFYVWL